MKNALFLVVIFALIGGVVSAQTESVLTESEFWEQMRTTETRLEQAIARGERERRPLLDEIRREWAAVTAVRLADTSVIAVDMRWLTEPLVFDNLDMLRQLRGRVCTLIAYHEGDTIASGCKHQVIPTPNPTNLPTRTPNTSSQNTGNGSSSAGLAGAGLSQFILIAAALVGVAMLLAYLARGLRVQPVSLEREATEADEDPVTSTGAREQAAVSQTARDYRMAIRYLYLESLLLLDERGIIRYDRTLTNREHLRQVENHPQIAAALHPVITIFEQVWYGFAPVDEQLFAAFQGHVEQLRRLKI